MVISNLKVNKKLKSNLAYYALVGTLSATCLTGCGKRENILERTMFEEASVITFDDGSKDIAIAVSPCDDSDFSHYRSVVSGVYFSDVDCNTDNNGMTIYHHYDIVNEESISCYLTVDELNRMMEGNIANEDIVNIVDRVMGYNANLKKKMKNK